MVLEIKHFDPRLRQYIHIDNDLSNSESILVERLENTLLEKYLPAQQFSFARVDQATTEQELQTGHPEGHVLLLASKSRFLYGPKECLNTIEKLCPDPKDRGAYGSIFLGGCSSTLERSLSILVVDDKTGANGGVLPDKVAFALVGDCHGKISPDLAQEISGTTSVVIQHRLGIPEDYFFAKGTLAPKDFSKLPFEKSNAKPDLILPRSSFKGASKSIQPGLIVKSVWLGEKERSQPGTISMSQLHSSFDESLREIAPKLELKAQKLAQIQSDHRSLAKHYVEKLEQSLSGKENQEENIMYRLIKQDVENWGQLLELPKVTQSLTEFMQRQWRNIAIGKAVHMNRAMCIPSKDLKHGEICIPSLPEGEQVLNFRSPFLNSNGMCVSTNKYVDEVLDPQGNPLVGVIAVNDEDQERIQARIDALTAAGIETQEVVPVETESQRQARDYDGDYLGWAAVHQFPALAQQAEFKNRPENAYAPTVKLEKLSFDPEWSFENIALFMRGNNELGIINNHVTAVEALEAEIDLLSRVGTIKQLQEFSLNLKSHFQSLIARENYGKLSPERREKIEAIAALNDVDEILSETKQLYRALIEAGCYQNQIAVDMFKSAQAPDMAAIALDRKILPRTPSYIREKKDYGVYNFKTLKAEGYSPVELLISQTNQYFKDSQLEARPTEQFRDFFPEVYSSAQYLHTQTAKLEFDRQFNVASSIAEKIRHEEGAVLKVGSRSGNSIEIVNLARWQHPHAFNSMLKGQQIQLVANREKNSYHRLLAMSQSKPNIWQVVGQVCERDRQKFGLEPGQSFQAHWVQLAAPTAKKEAEILFDRARAYATDWTSKIPESEKFQYAAAAWHLSTMPSEKNPYRSTNFVFETFGEQIIEQLKELQFTRFTATALERDTPESSWRGKEVSLEIKVQNGENVWQINDGDKSFRLGRFSSKGAQLPPGTIAKGKILADTINTATLEVEGIDTPISFGKVNQYEFAGADLNQTPVTVTIKDLPPTTQYRMLLDGKAIGELDLDSQKLLQERSLLQTGQKFQVSLQSNGSDKGKYILATTPAGNTLRINGQNLISHKDWRNHSFNGDLASVELKVQSSSKVQRGVYLQLGSEPKLAGVFTSHISHKSGISALKQAGLWKNGRTFDTIVTSNISIARVELDPQTVVYPEPNIPPLQKLNNLDDKTTEILTSATFPPPNTLIGKLDAVWNKQTLPTFRVITPLESADLVSSWLNLQGIEHHQIPHNHYEIEAETARGLVVVEFGQFAVSPSAQTRLTASLGSPLEAQTSDVNVTAPYYQALQQVQPLKPETLEQKMQLFPQYFEPFSFERNRDLPSLIAHEEYEWPDGEHFTEPLPTIRLTVDSRKLQATLNWLDQQTGVTGNKLFYQVANEHGDVSQEQEIGYSVVRILKSSTSVSTVEKLIDKLGTPLNSDSLDGSYYQTLESIQKGKYYEPSFSLDSHAKAIAILPPAITEENSFQNKYNNELKTPTQYNAPTDNIPLDPQFMQENLQIQQLRTQKVAPIVSALLHSHQTNHLEGKVFDAAWESDRALLTLSDKQGRVKMIASYNGQDEQGNTKWQAQPLGTNNSPLTEQDVKVFESFVPAIKNRILSNAQQLTK